MPSRRRRRGFDWNRACEDAARRHRRKGDLIIVGILLFLSIGALVAYYTVLKPV